VPLSILPKRQPRHPRHGLLRQDDPPAVGGDLGQRRVARRHLHRSRIGVHRLVCGRGRPAARHHAAIDPGTVFPCGDQPVRNRAVPFLELPTEYRSVELYRAFGVSGMDFEVDRAIHGMRSLRTRGYRALVLSDNTAYRSRRHQASLVNLCIRLPMRAFATVVAAIITALPLRAQTPASHTLMPVPASVTLTPARLRLDSSVTVAIVQYRDSRLERAVTRAVG